MIAAKPLWHDEIFTIYMCRLPDMASVWRALATGLEQMPPFSHVVSRAAYRLAGADAFAIRLPSLIGFAAMAACLYLFLARRVSRTWALAGMLVPFSSGALHFGYEGRSYGVVLGCTGIACLAWQSAGGRRRPLALAALALACAAAIASHYYAVLILMPLALGELVRTVERRKIDWGVWAALSVSLVPLAFFIPLIRGARSYAHVFWAKPDAASLQEAYLRLIGPAVPVFIALALVWLAYLVWGKAGSAQLDRAELALAAGFFAIPATMTVLSFFTGAFEPRYGIWGIVGLALGTAYAGHVTTAGSRRFAAIAAACWLGSFALTQGYELHRVGHMRPEAIERVEPLMGAGLPIVYADPIRYLQAAYYGAPEIRERVVYLADPDAALRRTGTDSPERAIQLLAGIAPLHVEAPGEFVARHHRFLVIESGDFSWVVPELAARRASVRVNGNTVDVRTYEVLLDSGTIAWPTPGRDAQALR